MTLGDQHAVTGGRYSVFGTFIRFLTS